MESDGQTIVITVEKFEQLMKDASQMKVYANEVCHIKHVLEDYKRDKEILQLALEHIINS
jgi:hypothetical protein